MRIQRKKAWDALGASLQRRWSGEDMYPDSPQGLPWNSILGLPTHDIVGGGGLVRPIQGKTGLFAVFHNWAFLDNLFFPVCVFLQSWWPSV